MKLKLLIIGSLAFVSFILISCSASKSQIISDDVSEQVIKETILMDDTTIETQPIPTQPYSLDKLFSLKLELIGVNESYAINLLESINPEYFEGLNKITFMYSHPDYREVNGWYYTDSKEIMIYMYDWEWRDYYKRTVIHEIKHHWCNINTGNGEITHMGCFLNTPIDQEYGYIK